MARYSIGVLAHWSLKHYVDPPKIMAHWWCSYLTFSCLKWQVFSKIKSFNSLRMMNTKYYEYKIMAHWLCSYLTFSCLKWQVFSHESLRMMNTKYSRKHSLWNSTTQQRQKTSSQRKQTNFRPNKFWFNQSFWLIVLLLCSIH